MYFLASLLTCFSLLSSQNTEARTAGRDRMLQRLTQLFSDDLTGDTPVSSQARTETDGEIQRDTTSAKRLKEITENINEQKNVSPVAQYILRRMLLDTHASRLLPKGNLALSRDIRADHVIGINSRENTFPWDLECSGGYDHCGGYFPMCCEGFVCLKPLTPWDIKHGFKRCWPHYFQEDENTETADES